jgi:hypothetical protein
MMEQTLKYIMARHKLQINNLKRAEQVELLEREGFVRINKTLLNSPGYTPNDRLEELILRGPDISYDYLLKLNSYDMSEETVDETKNKIESDRKYLAEMMKPDKFPGARLWLKELDILDELVKRARRESWLAWEVKPKWS